MLLTDPANPNLRRTLIAASLAVVVLAALSLLLIKLHLDERESVSIQLSENIVRQVQMDKLRRLATQTKDYSFWDEAATALKNGDTQWLDDNYGSYLLESFELDLSMVSDRADEILYHAAANEQTLEPKLLLANPEVQQLLESARNVTAPLPKAVSGVVKVSGQILMVAVAVITSSTDSSSALPRDNALLLARIMDAHYLSELESLLYLEDLTLADEITADEGNLALTSPTGDVLAYLHWNMRSSEAKLGPLALIFAGFALLIVLIAVGLLWQIYSLAQRYAHNAVIDDLTGLHNRRYFNSIADREIRRQCRTHSYIGFLLLDVDNFKKYNDIYGHQAGDAVLKAISAEMADSFGRASDHVCRLGGEEFGIIFVSPDSEQIAVLAEQLRARIQGLNISHAGNLPYGVITASIGGLVAHDQNGRCSIDRAYHYADQALYAAKSSGRNKICFKKNPDLCTK